MVQIRALDGTVDDSATPSRTILDSAVQKLYSLTLSLFILYCLRDSSAIHYNTIRAKLVTQIFKFTFE